MARSLLKMQPLAVIIERNPVLNREPVFNELRMG
jgi:hypothetical protein